MMSLNCFKRTLSILSESNKS